jgi:hypothetical protein
MGPIRCPKTSVNNYHSTPRNIPEERRSHQRRGGSLKSWVRKVRQKVKPRCAELRPYGKNEVMGTKDTRYLIQNRHNKHCVGVCWNDVGVLAWTVLLIKWHRAHGRLGRLKTSWRKNWSSIGLASSAFPYTSPCTVSWLPPSRAYIWGLSHHG